MDKSFIILCRKQHTNLFILNCTIAQNMITKPLHILFQFSCKQHLALPCPGWVGFYKPVFLLPFLMQQMCQQLIHSHMLHIIYIQLRQSACNVVYQNVTATHDTEFIGSKTVFIIVHHIGNTMHCNSGLPTSGYALHNHIMKRAGTDNLILLLLNGCNDIT